MAGGGGGSLKVYNVRTLELGQRGADHFPSEAGRKQGAQGAQLIPISGCSLLLQEMATHSSILSWRITWTEEPGGLQSMGSQRSGHERVTKQ